MLPDSPYRTPKAELQTASAGSRGVRIAAVVAGVFTTWTPIMVMGVISLEVDRWTASAELALVSALFACTCLAGGFVAARMARASAILNAGGAGAISAGMVVVASYSGSSRETVGGILATLFVAILTAALTALGGWIARPRSGSTQR